MSLQDWLSYNDRCKTYTPREEDTVEFPEIVVTERDMDADEALQFDIWRGSR